MNLLMRDILIVVLAVATTLLSGCGRDTKHPPIPAGSVVLAIGDSVTYGTGAGPGEDYPSRLAAMTGWTIHNHGIPGDTSAGVKSRIGEALTETTPKLVILEIGGNDFLKRQPEAETKDNVRTILRTIKQAGIPVVLVSTPKFSPLGAAVGMLPDAPIYKELADEEKVPLVPGIFAEVLSNAQLKADPIHPNVAGYRKLAEGIAAKLTDFGFLKKP